MQNDQNYDGAKSCITSQDQKNMVFVNIPNCVNHIGIELGQKILLEVL